ncbi:MAG: hypothetical protein R2800_07510 [Flavipsychrobacter sp.]
MHHLEDTSFIHLLDYLLLPFYLVIIFFIASKIRDAYYPPGHQWRPYFMPGLIAKILGGLFIGFIYQYYYGGGDTSKYFEHASTINSSFGESPIMWFKLTFRLADWYDGPYMKYINQMEWYEAPTEYMVATITALIATLTFSTYLPTSVLLASLAYTGIWALFRTFATKYPQYTLYIAIAVLFIPSTIMWGSGIFKDTICMFALGWLTYGVFRLLINRDFRISIILLTVFAFYLIANIKVYILIAFLPAIVFWILSTYSHYIKNPFARFFTKIGVIIICIGGFLFFASAFASTLGRYSLDKVAKTSYLVGNYISEQAGDAGSAYDIGEFSPTPAGMLSRFPAAVNVSLFRPYLWETRKPIQFINAIEATILLLLTIKVLFSVGLGRVWKSIATDPTIQFCLIFTLIFAFAVGLSSGTFGTLSRYRIPCLPFYTMMLVLIYYKNKPIESDFFAFNLK